MATLARTEPTLVWRRFTELTRIPRPPGQEHEAREHVLRWAKQRGLSSRVDDIGNVVVRVPASTGRERAPLAVLQAHLDMVCERDPGSPYDAREGRIEVELDGDWVRAEGTTLGADNGIGVAAAMAVVEDTALEHGPLELLFTVSEEQGLEGAKALDPAIVEGRVLLNLDGMSDRALTIGCAGSAHTFIRFPLTLGPLPHGHESLVIRLGGVRGGHSGGDIARGRVNAIKALGRTLARVERDVPLRLGKLEGGVNRNAIPREAQAVVSIPAGHGAALRRAAAEEVSLLRNQHAGTDDEFVLTVDETDAIDAADDDVSARALDLLAAIPTGVIAMSSAGPGVVETSTSLNVASTNDGVLTLASMTRSANTAALEGVLASLQASARLGNAETEVFRSYPPWTPNLDSPLLETARATYERVFGDEPALEIVHGGLECAVIGEKLPGIEMLSLGPTIEGPHAPGERLSVSSTQRFYRLLGVLLDDLSR